MALLNLLKYWVKTGAGNLILDTWDGQKYAYITKIATPAQPVGKGMKKEGEAYG